MDVARRNIEKLQGKISIRSQPGRGTTFLVELPLTLAVMDGLIVGVADQRYVVPALQVRQCFRPRAAMISAIDGLDGLLQWRGKFMPVVSLRRFFHAGEPKSIDESLGIIVSIGDEQLCLLADEVLRKQEIVIKPLCAPFNELPGLGGASILPDGRVAFILDINSLVRLTSAPTARAA